MTRARGPVLLLLAAGAAHADPLHGTVVDRTTQQPVAGAIVQVGNELVATDDNGNFDVDVPRGRYDVAVTADFIQPATQSVSVAGVTTVAIAVEPKLGGGETIEVEGIAPGAVGDITVSAKDARAVPGGGDAAKIVQSLPAVARPAAGSTEIVVWGAAPK